MGARSLSLLIPLMLLMVPPLMVLPNRSINSKISIRLTSWMGARSLLLLVLLMLLMVPLMLLLVPLGLGDDEKGLW